MDAGLALGCLGWQKELVEGHVLPAREFEPHFSEVTHAGEPESFVELDAGLVWRDDSGDDRVVSEVHCPRDVEVNFLSPTFSALPVHSRRNSSTVKPASSMIPRSVPFANSS